LEFLKRYWKDPKWAKIKGVFLFCLITIVIHFSFRWWVTDLGYFPIKSFFITLSDSIAAIVLQQSSWIILHLLRIHLTVKGDIIYFDNNSGIEVRTACSGLQQMLQLIILMLIYPGPWKHKLWFIPSGMVLIHFTNLFRIIGLAVIAIISPKFMKFGHDYILRTTFYVVIFGLWWLWVEKIVPRREIKKSQNPI